MSKQTKNLQNHSSAEEDEEVTTNDEMSEQEEEEMGEEEEEEEEEEAEEDEKEPQKENIQPGTNLIAVLKGKKKTTGEMVNDAIKNLCDRKGSSVQSIKKYIVQNFDVVDENRLRVNLKKYLREAQEFGILEQTKGHGAIGSFKLSAQYVKDAKNADKMKAKQEKDKAKKAKNLEAKKEKQKVIQKKNREQQMKLENKKGTNEKVKKKLVREVETVATKSPPKASQAVKVIKGKPKTAPKAELENAANAIIAKGVKKGQAQKPMLTEVTEKPSSSKVKPIMRKIVSVQVENGTKPKKSTVPKQLKGDKAVKALSLKHNN